MKIGIHGIDLWFLTDSSDNLKRKLLYFDKLLYEHGDLEILEKLAKGIFVGSNEFDKKMDEIELLIKNGYLEHVDNVKPKNLDYSKIDESVVESLFNLNKLVIKELQGIREAAAKTQTKELTEKDALVKFLVNNRCSEQISARHDSLLLNMTDDNNEYSPIISIVDDIPIDGQIAKKHEVISLVIDKFPLLDVDIELDYLMDFKSDSEITTNLFELRDFITSMAHSNLSMKEIKDKIEYLVHEYEQGLKRTKIKYNTTRFELIGLTTAKVIEELATLKFSSALKTVFDLRKNNLALYEAERKLLGKETAYIQKSHEFEKTIANNHS